MTTERRSNARFGNVKGTRVTNVSAHEIDPGLLKNPTVCGVNNNEVFIGRGSFSVVKLQVYRGIKVATKKFLPNTVVADVLIRKHIFLVNFVTPILAIYIWSGFKEITVHVGDAISWPV